MTHKQILLYKKSRQHFIIKNHESEKIKQNIEIKKKCICTIGRR